MEATPKELPALVQDGGENRRRLLVELDPAKLVLLLDGHSRVLEMIAEGDPLHLVLDKLMRVLEEQVDGMLCSVLLLSEDGKRLHLGAAPSLPDAYNRAVEGLAIGPEVGSCGTAAYLRQQVIASDITVDPRWARYKEIGLAAGLRACWSTPVLSRRGEVLGTFAMYYREPAVPSTLHLDLIALATHVARIAFERDALVRKLTHSIEAREESLSMLAVASHELRSPLAALRLQCESLIKPAPAEDAAAQGVARSLLLIDRLGRLVNDLLDVSSLSCGQLSLHLEYGDLAEIAREAVERMRGAFEQRGCSLDFASDGPIWGEWDRMRADQVVTNLLANALKYGNGRPVQVRASADERFGRVQVQDHGIGISPEQREIIFQRFGRAVAPHYEGVGLGLWISRQIVDALGGSLRVDSEPGQGSTFTVELPRSGALRTH